MAIKKRHKIEATFSMSSMTDIIFLLLLFFMIASTMSAPNDFKVNLPQSSAKTQTRAKLVKVGVSAEGAFSVATDTQQSTPIEYDELEPFLLNEYAQDTTMCVALHADEIAPFRDVVRVLDIANKNRIKIVVATKVKE